MRVIAGVAKGRRLLSVPGEGTRPITDRAKEALFSILRPELPGARVLDLFAGTGAVGIEALSRGAEHADFLDTNPRAIATIRKNLATTGLAAAARVMRRDAFDFLRRSAEGPYDVVFVAPPQYKGLWRTALTSLDARPDLLAEDAVIVVQIHPREAEDLPLATVGLDDSRQYGSVLLLFYRRSEADGAG
jgi:16S rRNA (guanine(966)-N(2))-methyltransferase RsmD